MGDVDVKLEYLKKSEWFKSKPPIVRDAICKMPPFKMYKIKDSGKQCCILSYDEPLDGSAVTLKVMKTGIGGAMASMGLGCIDKNIIFGIELDDLDVWAD